MKNMKVPTRAPPPPPVPGQQNKLFPGAIRVNNSYEKKKPPPRPPPPDFTKLKSKSAWNLNSHIEDLSLIDFNAPINVPCSQDTCNTNGFGGSISSSFSNSTSSLASSKKSYELENISDVWSLYSNSASQSPVCSQPFEKSTVPVSMPTIIRAQNNKWITNKKSKLAGNESPPMPKVPPPSPPKDSVEEIKTPYAVALYNYPAPYDGDLLLEVDDIVVLLKKVNEEWYYGRVGEKEGIFPKSFVDIQVPLEEINNVVVSNKATALYDFIPQLPGDLALQPGKIVTIIGRISNDWLIGESDGNRGQFPANFIDKVPSNI